MFNKKGLSNIIATVLIILLALAAVVIVWQFIRPTIESGGQSVSLESLCLEVEAVPTSCDITANSVVVQLKKGDPKNIARIIAIIEADTGERATANTTSIPAVLGTSSAAVTEQGTGPFTARAAVEVQDDAGNTRVCAESATVVTCS